MISKATKVPKVIVATVESKVIVEKILSKFTVVTLR
jgi:hypothetical protein